MLFSEEQKTETWSRILAECAARGHHWVKGKDVTYLKKSKWPGIKRDAIEHYQADMKSDVSHRKKLTEADAIVLKAISFDTENLGSLADKDTPGAACAARRECDVTQPVTVEVKAGEPLDLLACGMHISEGTEKFNNGLLVDLFPKKHTGARKISIPPVEQEHRYSKRQRVDDDGPIDHDLMAALGFGKNRQKNITDSSEHEIRKSVDADVTRAEQVTTIGDYLRSVNTLPPPATKEEDIVPHNLWNTVERKPLTDPPKCLVPLHRAVVSSGTVSAAVSPKDNCRDVKILQKRAYEAQIARVSS
ncbi:hypothetical protein NECAME_13942, partial [Necator americanus]